MALEDKKLIDLANEQDQAKFKDEFSKLSEEEKKKVSDHLTDEAVRIKTERDAATAEKRRQEQLAEQARKDAETNKGGTKSFEEKFRDENIAEAHARVFVEMGITKDEDKQAIRDTFKKLDSGAVNVDNIIKDVKKAVLAAKPDEFLDSAKRIKDMEAGADEFNRSGAGGDGRTIDRTNGKQYSKEAQDMVTSEARKGRKLSLDDAENYLQKGATRIIR